MENQPNTTTTPTETKFCQHCGQKIPKDAVLCTQCGRMVEEQQTAPAPQIVINNDNNNVNSNVNQVSRIEWVFRALNRHFFTKQTKKDRSHGTVFFICFNWILQDILFGNIKIRQ